MLWRVAACLVPTATGALGLLNGPNDLRSAGTSFQSLAAWCAVSYGVFGVALAAGLLFGRPWSRPLTVLWGIPLTLAAGLAPVVWGDVPVQSGILSGVISAMIVAIVVWLARRAIRPDGGATAS